MSVFAIELAVRYSDVDERAVVNNARYLNYFEEARMALLDKMLAECGADFRGNVIVAHAACDYLQPLVLRDRVRIETGIARIGNKSFDVGYRMLKPQGELVAKGLTTQVRFDYAQKQTQPLSDAQRTALASYPFQS